MGKSVGLLVFGLLIASALGEVPADVQLKSLQFSLECMQNWQVTFETVAKAIYTEDPFPNDKNFKGFALCMAKKTGLLDENGNIQTDTVIQHLKWIVSSDEEVKRLMDKCVTKHETPQDTAYEVTNCVHLEGVTI